MAQPPPDYRQAFADPNAVLNTISDLAIAGLLENISAIRMKPPHARVAHACDYCRRLKTKVTAPSVSFRLPHSLTSGLRAVLGGTARVCKLQEEGQGVSVDPSQGFQVPAEQKALRRLDSVPPAHSTKGA